MARTNSIMPGIIGAAIIVGLMALSVGCRVSRFKECRDHGFSTFYCLREFSR